MKPRRLLIIVSALAALVIVALLVASATWQRKPTPFQNGPGLIAALQAFSRDQLARGRRLPAEVSLQDLVRGGYLTTNDIRAFEGIEVTFNTQADDSHPQMILARARMPDGQLVCLLADGSVQQLSRSKYEDQLRLNPEGHSATNGNLPAKPEIRNKFKL